MGIFEKKIHKFISLWKFSKFHKFDIFYGKFHKFGNVMEIS